MMREIHPDDPNAQPLLPGTLFFGVIYGDGSAGSWNPNKSEVLDVVSSSREIGLTVIGILRVRMKHETLAVIR